MKFMLTKREPLSVLDGISQFLFSLADALLRLGHAVVCVTSYDDNLGTVPRSYDFSQYPELEALGRHDANMYNPSLAARLWRQRGRAVVARHNPDFVLLNGALPFRFHQATALVVHDLQTRKFFGNIGRQVFKALTYRLVDQLVVSCPELAGPAARDSWCSQKRFLVIPTCIDTRRYTPSPLSGRQPVILHSGFVFYKAPRATLAAFAAMQNKEARLVIVGRADPAFAAEAAALPPAVRRRIEMPGMVSAEELKALLGTSRIMSVPSKYDLPVASPTVLEALASHTPCVLSSSISKVVAADGKNCFVEDTIAGMARRFDELTTQDQTWLALSAGCEETKVKFDSLTVARQYVELAERLTG